jgi:IclR family pca regulon transcriptional regulator
VDEGLERGAPLDCRPGTGTHGQAVGAIDLSAHTTRTTRNELRDKYLPKLRRMARQISQAP